MADVQATLEISALIDQQTLSSLGRSGIRAYASRGLDHFGEASLTSLWPKLVQSALSQNISERYLTAACNAISVYLTTLLGSQSEALRSFATSRNVWREGFDCAQYAFACGRTKPALQVLETLAYLLNEHSDKRTAFEILEETSEVIIGTILTDDPRGTIKASCISLSCLLRKTTLSHSLHTIIERSLSRHDISWKQRRAQGGAARNADTVPFSSLQELLLALLFAVNNLETRSAALKLFTQICASEMQMSIPPITQAAQVLEYYIQENRDLLADFANNVFPVLLATKLIFDAFACVYAPVKDGPTSKIYLYVAVLKVGRLKQFLTEDELPGILNEALEGQVVAAASKGAVYRSFDRLLEAGDSSIRINTYSLLTASFATRASIPLGVLDCLKRNFHHLHDENDAYERGEIISITRRFLKRLDSSYSNLKKLQQAEKASNVELRLVIAYEDFVKRLYESLNGELEMGVSYQRHIMALGNLQLLLTTSFDSWYKSSTLTARLELLVIDAYEDVRAVASSVLASMEKKLPRNFLRMDQQFLKRVLALSARTCRNDHADAAGRLMVLLFPDQLRMQKESVAQHGEPHLTLSIQTVIRTLWSHLSDLKMLRPNTEFPLHAHILALHHSYASDTINDDNAEAVLDICGRIWLLVQPELCIDSPETGTEESDEVNVGGPKDLLAYAWRALRDSSLLLQSIMRSNRRYLSQIGSLCMEELIMLRHRGAFSTVAQTFTMCCDEARASEEEALLRLLRQWYEIALSQIDAQASKVTRRSAGLPAMFNAILSPQDEQLFQEAVQTLKYRAGQDVLPQHAQHAEQSLPHVHALNCIKDIITNSRFRTVTEQFILEMIELAADRISSSVWAIRNCGLMLLRACMNRLDPKMLVAHTSCDAGASAASGPTKVALTLLQQVQRAGLRSGDDDAQRSEKIFAALDLVRHIGVPRNEIDPFQSLLESHLGGPVWLVREQAARVLAARMTTNSPLDQTHRYLPITIEASENDTHGLLLFYQYAYRFWEAQDGRDTWLSLGQLIQQMSKRVRSKATSPFVQGAVLDIVNDALRSAVIRDLRSTNIVEPVKTLLAGLQPTHSYSRQRVLLCKILLSLLDVNGIATRAEESATYQAGILPAAEVVFVAEALAELAPKLRSDLQQSKLCHRLIDLIEDSDSLLPQLYNSITTSLETNDLALTVADAHRLEPYTTTTATSGDRDLWNAQIRLRAHVLKAMCTSEQTSVAMTVSLNPWLHDLKAATNDELEFSTRLNAAHSLLVFASSRSGNLNDTVHRYESAYLLLLLILYDQLNDDDEAIRRVAQRVANKALPQSPRRISFEPCALSAREALLCVLAERFNQSSTLPSLAIGRVIGHRVIAAHDTSFLDKPVETRLADIVSKMNDLFAEEKQNLYIDESEEIQKWSRILSTSSINIMSTSVRQGTVSWTVQGLKALESALLLDQETASDRSGLGLTYNTAILELSLRVIHLARGLLRLSLGKHVHNDTGEPVWKISITEALDSLATVLHRTGAHPTLITAATDE